MEWKLGAIETPLTEALKKTNPEIMDWFAKAAPVGRLGLPADLTPMVCYLLSDAGSFNTGADMVVTGMFRICRFDAANFADALFRWHSCWSNRWLRRPFGYEQVSARPLIQATCTGLEEVCQKHLARKPHLGLFLALTPACLRQDLSGPLLTHICLTSFCRIQRSV